MSKSKHTRAPWGWTYFNSYPTQIVGPDGRLIADVADERDWSPSISPPSNGYEYQEGEAWANAYLMTQSPAMYDLLQRVLDSGDINDTLLMADIYDAMERVRTGHETHRDRLSRQGG